MTVSQIPLELIIMSLAGATLRNEFEITKFKV